MLFNGKTAAGLLAVIIALASAVSCGKNDNNSGNSSSRKQNASKSSSSVNEDAPDSDTEENDEEDNEAVPLSIVDNGCLEWNGDVNEKSVTIESVTYELIEDEELNEFSDGISKYYSVYSVDPDTVPIETIDGKEVMKPKLYGKINGIPVITFKGDWLFKCRNKGKRIEVNIPNTIINLPQNSMGHLFQGEVTIPSNVKYILPGAFINPGMEGGNPVLNSVIISDGTELVGTQAFWSCGNLEKVTISDTVTSIGVMAFDYCTNLKEIKLSKNCEALLNSFRHCENLKKVEIPEGVKYIGGAFDYCVNLEEVIIPESVEVIGYVKIDTSTEEQSSSYSCSGGFQGCSSLKTITILNPNCEFKEDDMKDPPIFSVCNYEGSNKTYTLTGVIRGYKGSTAEEYAKKYNFKFEAI